MTLRAAVLLILILPISASAATSIPNELVPAGDPLEQHIFKNLVTECFDKYPEVTALLFGPGVAKLKAKIATAKGKSIPARVFANSSSRIFAGVEPAKPLTSIEDPALIG